MSEKDIMKIKKIFEDYSIELDDSGHNLIENDGYYYECARRIYWAGYRLPSEFEVLGDEEIRYKLEQIQPEGFNWADTTDTEMSKFRAIAQAQLDKDQRQIKGE